MEHPLFLRLDRLTLFRLSRIAKDMRRTPEELVEAIVKEWSLAVYENLSRDKKPAMRRKRQKPPGREHPDFISSGVLVSPKRHSSKRQTDR